MDAGADHSKLHAQKPTGAQAVALINAASGAAGRIDQRDGLGAGRLLRVELRVICASIHLTNHACWGNCVIA